MSRFIRDAILLRAEDIALLLVKLLLWKLPGLDRFVFNHFLLKRRPGEWV